MTFPDETLNDSQDQANNSSGTGETAAPWADYMKDLPDSVRPLVEPKFKDWDANVTKRFQQVHSEYDDVKPFKALVESGIDFDTAQQAIQFAQLVNEDPERVYKALAEQYGYGAEQGSVDPDAGNVDDEQFGGLTAEDFTKNPEFAKYREMTEQMAEIMVQQQQAVQMAEEEAALDATLASLKEQHGDFDEEYVMTKVYSGASWDEAINAYNSLAGKFQQPNAPVVMGSGGGLPSQSINPAQMSDKDRKNLVAQIAAQANKG